MEIDELDITLLDLKYCERCGCLWLRPRSCEDVLCVQCAREMSKLQRAWGKHSLRLILKTTIEAEGEGKETLVICSEGGNA